MSAQNVPTDEQEPVHVSDHGPPPVANTSRGRRIGEFREGPQTLMRGVIAATGFSSESRLDLACDYSATRYAVAHASGVLRDWGVPRDVVADALLIVDELVTNAVRHAGVASDPFEAERGRPRVGGCGLGLWTCRGYLVICVHDETDRVPVLREVSLDAEDGRGLQIVAGLCDGAWGYVVQPSRQGKSIWARLPLPSRAPHCRPADTDAAVPGGPGGPTRSCTEKEIEINEQQAAQLAQPASAVQQPKPWSTPGSWTITTTAGLAVSGHLPEWAEDDPSEIGVPQDLLPARLAGINHRNFFEGTMMALTTTDSRDDAEEDAVFEGSIDCNPYDPDTRQRVPVVNIQVCLGHWILGLNPQELTDTAAKLRAQADRLHDEVLPALIAAREDWATHQPA